MEVSYPIIVVLLVIVIAFIIMFIRKNKKDKKSMEKELDAYDTKPDKHDSGSI